MWSVWCCPVPAGFFPCSSEVFRLIQEQAVRPASRAADRWAHTQQRHTWVTCVCSYASISVKTPELFPFITGSSPNSSHLPQPLFKRVVIMLVDALREDFVFGASGRMYMPYTRHLVERGSSHSFVAKARPPTVTMPRIKVRSLWGHSGIMMRRFKWD